MKALLQKCNVWLMEFCKDVLARDAFACDKEGNLLLDREGITMPASVSRYYKELFSIPLPFGRSLAIIESSVREH